MDKNRGRGIYFGIKARCYNKKCVSYKYYGARGITMCQEWLDDQEEFLDWLEYSGWYPGCEVHRENRELGYSPENCVVMSRETHQRVTRANASKFVSELNKMGLSAKDLADRWGITPRQIANIGRNPSVKDWCALEGVRQITLRKAGIDPSHKDWDSPEWVPKVDIPGFQVVEKKDTCVALDIADRGGHPSQKDWDALNGLPYIEKVKKEGR